MKRILVTGMSGVGKSTVVARLAELGHRAVDLDSDSWSEWVDSADGGPSPSEPGRDWVWRADRVKELLADEQDGVLFVSGCASNMGQFRDRFAGVVLLSVTAEVMAERLTHRTTNVYESSRGSWRGAWSSRRRSNRCCATARIWSWTGPRRWRTSWRGSSASQRNLDADLVGRGAVPMLSGCIRLLPPAARAVVTGPEQLAVIAAGLGAGMLTSTVGVASLISFPALIALGIPPVVANASNTIGLLPGALSGSFGYRRELREIGRSRSRSS